MQNISAVCSVLYYERQKRRKKEQLLPTKSSLQHNINFWHLAVEKKNINCCIRKIIRDAHCPWRPPILHFLISICIYFNCTHIGTIGGHRYCVQYRLLCYCYRGKEKYQLGRYRYCIGHIAIVALW
jgi:hypothetical protein